MEVKEEKSLFPDDYLRFWITVYYERELSSFEQFQQNLTVSEKQLLNKATTFEEQSLSSFAYFREYPHIELAIRLYYIYIFKNAPVQNEGVDGYNAKQEECACLSSIMKELVGGLELINQSKSDQSNIQQMRHCLQLLQSHGIQHLMGLRHTVGSVDIMYPPRDYLYSLFNKLHDPKALLTVGARALSKHSIRCKSKWGELRGPEKIQNATAVATLDRILEHCTWINIHALPHGIICLEIRTKDGFGGRWDLVNNSFRGFVEPYMENGYEAKWRHNEP